MFWLGGSTVLGGSLRSLIALIFCSVCFSPGTEDVPMLLSSRSSVLQLLRVSGELQLFIVDQQTISI